MMVLSTTLLAQTTLSTRPLSVTAACPGTTVAVSFSLTGSISTSATYTVQLSDGGDYRDIPTKPRLVNYESIVRATIPTDLPTDRTYSVRVRATSPDILGSPSPTKLVIKGKRLIPAPPSVDSLILTCDGFSTKDYDRFVTVNLRLATGATPRLYRDETSDDFSEYAEYPQCTNSVPDSVACKTMATMYVYKAYYYVEKYVYPLDEKIYYVSELVDGCESERVPTKVRILWRPSIGPTPVNQNKPSEGNYHYGHLTYCQGQQAYPLNVNGHTPPPENYHVVYYNNAPISLQDLLSGGTLIPPVPDTRVPNRLAYSFSLVPIDSKKGCPLIYNNPNDLFSATSLLVTVDPQPAKPTALTSIISYYQGQASTPLSATTTDSTATLVWYGTNATGGTGLTMAPQPPTSQAGQFTYYVAQKAGTCESERVPIQVRINPLLSVDDPSLADAIAIFPNPAISSLTVRISGLSARQPAQLDLIDLNGQIVLHQETQRETSILTLDDYPKGSYLLLIKVDNRRASRRVMKL